MKISSLWVVVFNGHDLKWMQLLQMLLTFISVSPPNQFFRMNHRRVRYKNPTWGQAKNWAHFVPRKTMWSTRNRMSCLRNKLLLDITFQRFLFEIDSYIIEDVINIPFVSPWFIIFAWIVVGLYQVSTWGTQNFTTIKKLWFYARV